VRVPLAARIGRGSVRTGIVRTTAAPDGTRWEISVLRFVPPEWQPGDYVPVGGRVGLFLDETPLSAILNGFLLPLIRYSIALPSAIAKGRDSNVIWIEAKSEFPVHETYYWTTSPDHVAKAVDDIAAGLKLGETAPRTLRAFYFGTKQR
jgi:hypothetical protein